MCNNCNWSNRSSCGCGCGCQCCNQYNQCGLFNMLFGNTQSVCRDCYGNLVVRNTNPCARNFYNYGCALANDTSSASGNGNGFACVSYCQRANGNGTLFSGNDACYNTTANGRCGCNAYSAWAQENYGE